MLNRKNTFLLAALTCALVFAPRISKADEDSYFGAMLGPSFLNQGLGTRFAVGAHGGTKVTPEFSLGGYFTFEKLGTLSHTGGVQGGTSSASTSANQYVIALEPRYYPNSDNGLWFGLKLGIGITTAHITLNQTGTAFVVGDAVTDVATGPAVGYMYTADTNIGFGIQLNDTIVATPNNVTNAVDLLASINYLF